MRDRPEPTLADIDRLAAELQLALPPSPPDQATWPERLRLLAQWAVKPESYNAAFLRYVDGELRGARRQAFLQAREAVRAQGKEATTTVTALPDYDLYCYRNGRLRALSKLPTALSVTPGLRPDYRAFYPYGVELGEWNIGGHGRLIQIEPAYDPTPNEWGVRAWALQALAVCGWRSPLACDLPLANPQQWRHSSGPPGNHPLADSGEAQLRFWGCDLPGGQWRPTATAWLWDTVYYVVDAQGAIAWLKAIHPGLTYQFPQGVAKERVHPLWQDWRTFSTA